MTDNTPFNKGLHTAILVEMGMDVDSDGNLMATNPKHGRGYNEGVIWTALAAARISAERAATRQGLADEELAQLVWASRQQRTAERGRFDQSYSTSFSDLDSRVVRDLVDDARAVREALTAQGASVPEIPEGWELLAVLNQNQGKSFNATVFRPNTNIGLEASGPTWHEALANAVTAINATTTPQGEAA